MKYLEQKESRLDTLYNPIQKVLTTKSIKIIKVYEYLIPSNVVGIKKIEVSAMLKGRANIVLNLVGPYDQTS